MSSQLSIKVGNTTVPLTIGANITDAQVGAALTRYAKVKDIPVNGTAAENLLAILTYWVNDVKRISKTAQREVAIDAALVSIDSQIDADNNL